MRTVKIVALAALLVVGATAHASEETSELGPWRLGMSREDVTGFGEHGPYETVRSTGGLETHSAQIGPLATNVSFVFEDDSLRFVQYWVYEGRDADEAAKAVLKVYDYFGAHMEGAEIPKLVGTGGTAPTRDELVTMLPRFLAVTQDTGLEAQKEDRIVALTMFDLVPKQQLTENRLHCHWAYHSRYDTFFVFLYIDRKDAPSRDTDINVQLDRL